MENNLALVEPQNLTKAELTNLDKKIMLMIERHKNSRQQINRLVFDSISSMTEADDAQVELSSKSRLQRFIGSFTGSNQRLRDKISNNRAVAQYAAQQTIVKLAEQNLMTLDLVAAVNNKLNATALRFDEKINEIYKGLHRFFKYTSTEIKRLDERINETNKNVNLLKWVSSIRFQKVDEKEYSQLTDIWKIVCLVRDFYNITGGNWGNDDLLLLKQALSDLDVDPKKKINYYSTIQAIYYNKAIKDKLLDNGNFCKDIEPQYLISFSSIKKLDDLNNEESYVVNAVIECLNENKGVFQSVIELDNSEVRKKICLTLTKNYISEFTSVKTNDDIEVESYDFVLDILYNLGQAIDEGYLTKTSLEKKITNPVSQQSDQYYRSYEDNSF